MRSNGTWKTEAPRSLEIVAELERYATVRQLADVRDRHPRPATEKRTARGCGFRGEGVIGTGGIRYRRREDARSRRPFDPVGFFEDGAPGHDAPDQEPVAGQAPVKTHPPP